MKCQSHHTAEDVCSGARVRMTVNIRAAVHNAWGKKIQTDSKTHFLNLSMMRGFSILESVNQGNIHAAMLKGL